VHLGEARQELSQPRLVQLCFRPVFGIRYQQRVWVNWGVVGEKAVAEAREIING
jgi:hypothetical protein